MPLKTKTAHYKRTSGMGRRLRKMDLAVCHIILGMCHYMGFNWYKQYFGNNSA